MGHFYIVLRRAETYDDEEEEGGVFRDVNANDRFLKIDRRIYYLRTRYRNE